MLVGCAALFSLHFHGAYKLIATTNSWWGVSYTNVNNLCVRGQLPTKRMIRQLLVFTEGWESIGLLYPRPTKLEGGVYWIHLVLSRWRVLNLKRMSFMRSDDETRWTMALCDWVELTSSQPHLHKTMFSLQSTADTLRKQVKDEIHSRTVIQSRISSDTTDLSKNQTEIVTKKEKVSSHLWCDKSKSKWNIFLIHILSWANSLRLKQHSTTH